MKKTAAAFTLIFTAGLVAAAFAVSETGAKHGNQIVASSGNGKTMRGPSGYFTGEAVIQPIAPEISPSRNTVAYVTFEAGARSNWHDHDAGQTLVVTSGTAWTQEWNGKAYAANPGDVIYCPPRVKHFHGASPAGPMTHVSIVESVNGKNVTWMEPVTDAQYQAAGKQIKGE